MLVMRTGLIGVVALLLAIGCGSDEPAAHPAPWCGNGSCDWGENVLTCPADCGTCGNGVCDPGETLVSCPSDCSCGNGVCDPEETATSCPADCRFCGNGSCDWGENHANCPADCFCHNGTCDQDEDSSSCRYDCGYCGDGICGALESTGSCPDDCVCGNGLCDPGEDVLGCPHDCYCANLSCDPGEDEATCAEDCLCRPGHTCGNGLCEPGCGETYWSCHEDCSSCQVDLGSALGASALCSTCVAANCCYEGDVYVAYPDEQARNDLVACAIGDSEQGPCAQTCTVAVCGGSVVLDFVQAYGDCMAASCCEPWAACESDATCLADCLLGPDPVSAGCCTNSLFQALDHCHAASCIAQHVPPICGCSG